MQFRSHFWRRIVGSVLLIGGVTLLLFAAANLAYRQWQDWRLARAMALVPTRIVVSERSSLPTIAIPTMPPSPTPELPAQETVGPPAELPNPGAEEIVEPTPTPIITVAPTAAPVAPPTVPLPTPTRAPSPPPVSSSLPVRLIMPWLNLDVPVVEMFWKVVDTPNGRRSEWIVPDNAGGHHTNSANPGEAGNVVISGHNNIKGQVFKPISVAFDPKQPDKFLGERVRLVAADGRTFNYTVKTVHFFLEKGATLAERQENGRVMSPTSEPMLTIITCWPPQSNTHRIVIQA
ncbi:MAG: sortase, partial [Anaerolineae bacterium]|nr:sortase [Anaerolineae bacterium]